ncbi:MAG TPA: aldehyde dehydrogenase family protein, partial [Novosphingobium sp.]|nr:aldehyde dehydrogenase family protein [Novosphingobium sp.]
STAAGQHIAALCAGRVARCSLELGGKSAAILCEDVDLAAALPALLPVAMPFSGQICFSQTRLLLPASRYDEMLEALVGAIDGITLGDPWEAGTMMGPLAMARQRARVLGYIAQGRAEGARLLCGGDNGGFARGYFVAPTLFADVQPAMAIAREEIFGPVLSVLRYRDEAEAIALANDSAFGLSGTVFTPDLERGTQIARAVRTGNISINTLQLDPAVPFGGFRQSGIGREGGPEGLAVFQETKAIYLPVLAPHTL